MKKLFLIILAVFASGILHAQDTSALVKLRQERKLLAGKKRRVIFNNDGNEPFRHVKEISAKGLLAPRTLGLENTQVDAIFYCTSHAWGNFSHNTSIGSVLTVKEDPAKATLFKNNLTGELIAAGLDPLKVMTDWGHKHSKEVFWSMRMNDTHDGGKSGYGPVLFNANRIKTQHPEYLVGTKFEKGQGSWSAANYALPVVRDLTYRFIEEVCQKYDVDGIELDFFRHRVFFKSTFKGQKATAAETAAMTDLVRRLRKMTETEGLKRKRPILIAIRVPDDKVYCKDIGLDVEGWLKEGLADMMIPSGYIRLNPWQTSIALGHQYGVQVYPNIEDSRIADTAAVKLRNTPESFRAQALEAWMAGADGVYMFNFFDPKSNLWKQLGNPAVLTRLNRDHFSSVRGVGKVAAVNHKPYIKASVFGPETPVKVNEAGVSESILFKKGPLPGKTVLGIRLKGNIDIKNISIKLNGHLLGVAKQSADWLYIIINPDIVLDGGNQITVAQKGNPEIWWMDLELSYWANFSK